MFNTIYNEYNSADHDEMSCSVASIFAKIPFIKHYALMVYIISKCASSSVQRGQAARLLNFVHAPLN